jgi:hypothetical protein
MMKLVVGGEEVRREIAVACGGGRRREISVVCVLEEERLGVFEDEQGRDVYCRRRCVMVVLLGTEGHVRGQRFRRR